MQVSKILGERNDYIENIYEDPEHNFYIQIPYNYIKPKNYPQGYMKVYFGNNMARISFFGPYYIYAENGNSKLSKEEIDMLIDALNKPYEYGDGETIFQEAILEINAGHHEDDYPPKGLTWIDIPENLPMPDYTKLI